MIETRAKSESKLKKKTKPTQFIDDVVLIQGIIKMVEIGLMMSMMAI